MFLKDLQLNFFACEINLSFDYSGYPRSDFVTWFLSLLAWKFHCSSKVYGLNLNTIFLKGEFMKNLCTNFWECVALSSKAFFCLVSPLRKEFTNALLLKVLYLRYLLTLGLILGKCIFIRATNILWKSDRSVSITVVV